MLTVKDIECLNYYKPSLSILWTKHENPSGFMFLWLRVSSVRSESNNQVQKSGVEWFPVGVLVSLGTSSALREWFFWKKMFPSWRNSSVCQDLKSWLLGILRVYWCTLTVSCLSSKSLVKLSLSCCRPPMPRETSFRCVPVPPSALSGQTGRPSLDLIRLFNYKVVMLFTETWAEVTVE